MNDFAHIETALKRLAEGGLVVVRDDEGRENEGDLVGSASLATPEMVNFMVSRARGLVCQPITAETAERLQLQPQAPFNTESLGTAFTVSVDAAGGITTGISASDRAVTARLLADPTTSPSDLRRPGHIFPLAGRRGGVFARPGHTEASLDLMRLAHLPESALICEILSDDGTMARGQELEERAKQWGLPLISVTDVIAYRKWSGDFAVTASTPARLPTPFGEFTVTAFHTDDPDTGEAVLLEAPGEDGSVPLVRIHSECLTGETFHSARCDCGAQLDRAMEMVAARGGAIVYLRQEGRGIGLFDKIRAYTLQDEGLDTVDANVALGHPPDRRDYGVATAVLRARKYTRVQLLTNNPEKIRALEDGGILVDRRVQLHVGRSRNNAEYMATKFLRMGHIDDSGAHISGTESTHAKEYV